MHSVSFYLNSTNVTYDISRILWQAEAHWQRHQHQHGVHKWFHICHQQPAATSQDVLVEMSNGDFDRRTLYWADFHLVELLTCRCFRCPQQAVSQQNLHIGKMFTILDEHYLADFSLGWDVHCRGHQMFEMFSAGYVTAVKPSQRCSPPHWVVRFSKISERLQLLPFGKNWDVRILKAGWNVPCSVSVTVTRHSQE